MIQDTLAQILNTHPFIIAVMMIGVMIVLFYIVVNKYLTYARYRYLSEKVNWTLLEIIIPQEITKSPESMELFFMNTIWWDKGTSTNKIKMYLKGETRVEFSFEIVSFGGTIHFFMHTPTHLIDLAKAQFYAQYPQVEIRQVGDYVDRIPFFVRDDIGLAMFGWEYVFKKPDAYPIRTYRDWKTDRSVELDREQQIDPMVAMIEKLASIDPWEEMWLQIGVRIEKDDSWRKEGEKLIDSIIAGHRRVVKSENPNTPMVSTLTKGEQEVVDAIDRQLGHMHAFEVGIRSIYLSRKPEKFNANKITFLKGIFEPFNSHALNSIKAANPTGYDNPWEDFDALLENTLKDAHLERYRARDFYGEKATGYSWKDFLVELLGSYKAQTMIMSAEELATLFHLPAGFSQSPSVKRTDTRKAQPPSNLPL
ncbi:MAG: hypothetical protein LRY46_00635 [Candidatus Pacebacteria bacterium]|nr:hypothetical protein [Candidatus Paceibacterota bacterium]MCD8507864.1 hypothetical protein [Candidatus Paceibacterota bacterium]MCD8563947.1 hypothetical protein [Candidatus Paceibacterota bacterium]